MRIPHQLKLGVSALAIAIAAASFADGSDREEIVVIKAGRVVTVSGETMDDAEIVIVDGKIELVGRDLEYPKAAKIIDAREHTVMPGMIHAHSRYGLRTYSRSGVTANRTASEEVDLEEFDFEPFLEAGYTAVCFYPTGRGINGQTSLYRTAGSDDARLLDEAVHVQVPMTTPVRDKAALRGALKKAQAEIDKVEKARTEWEKKQKEEEAKRKAEEAKKESEEKKEKPADGAPREGGGDGEEPEKKEEAEKKEPAKFEPPKMDPAYLPFVEMLQEADDARPMLIQLSRASDLLHLDDVLENRDDELPYVLYIAPGFRGDFNNVIEELGERGGIVLTPIRMYQLPSTSVRYNLVGELALAGCEVALVPPGDSPTGWRDQRSLLTDLVRSGLPRDHAVRALTLTPAKLLGVDDRLGSIEKGKDADLIILDGTGPLDPHARVDRVMIQGRIVWDREDDS